MSEQITWTTLDNLYRVGKKKTVETTASEELLKLTESLRRANITIDSSGRRRRIKVRVLLS